MCSFFLWYPCAPGKGGQLETDIQHAYAMLPPPRFWPDFGLVPHINGQLCLFHSKPFEASFIKMQTHLPFHEVGAYHGFTISKWNMTTFISLSNVGRVG